MHACWPWQRCHEYHLHHHDDHEYHHDDDHHDNDDDHEYLSTNEDRERLANKLLRKKNTKNKNQALKLNKAKGPTQLGYVVDDIHIKQSLLVLLQHNIVNVRAQHAEKNDSHKKCKVVSRGSKHDADKTYMYSFDPVRARLILRYRRYVEYAKRALDEKAVALLEELLIHGRMTTYDAIVAAVDHVLQKQWQEEEEGEAIIAIPTVVTVHVYLKMMDLQAILDEMDS